jgi:hypothetical protein
MAASLMVSLSGICMVDLEEAKIYKISQKQINHLSAQELGINKVAIMNG